MRHAHYRHPCTPLSIPGLPSYQSWLTSYSHTPRPSDRLPTCTLRTHSHRSGTFTNRSFLLWLSSPSRFFFSCARVEPALVCQERKPVSSLVGLFSLLPWPVLPSACSRSSFSISDHAWSTAFRKGCARVCARARASMGLRCCVLVAGCSIMACHDHRDPWRPRDGLWAVKQQDLAGVTHDDALGRASRLLSRVTLREALPSLDCLEAAQLHLLHHFPSS